MAALGASKVSGPNAAGFGSGGQWSEGDARRYYCEHKNSRAMTFGHYYIDIPNPDAVPGATEIALTRGGRLGRRRRIPEMMLPRMLAVGTKERLCAESLEYLDRVDGLTGGARRPVYREVVQMLGLACRTMLSGMAEVQKEIIDELQSIWLGDATAMSNYNPFKGPVPEAKPRSEVFVWSFVKDIRRLPAHSGPLSLSCSFVCDCPRVCFLSIVQT
jgi:hypothetical protein